MATRVLDSTKVIELLRKYRPTLEQSGAAGGINISMKCPFHPDTHPSFTFNIAYNIGRCFSCQARANLTKLIAKFENIDEEQSQKLVSPCLKTITQPAITRKKSVIDISEAQIAEWCVSLETDVNLQKHMAKWGWNQDIQKKYQLGSSEGRLTIPIYEGPDLIGLKFYAPGKSGQRYQNAPNTTPSCWPIDNLRHDVVYLVEGEKDCLTMLSAGFNAVSFTAGAGQVPMSYVKYFAGKDVYIIYDIDEAGRNGAAKAAKILNFAARRVFIVDLPIEGIPKGDITDAYMNDPANFSTLIHGLCEHTDVYVAPEANARVEIPPEIVRTYLEDIVSNKMFYKRINMKVRVVNNAQHETMLVPKDVILSCNKDFKEQICAACPAFFQNEGMCLNIKPEYPELMSIVGNNTKVQRAAIQSMLGTEVGCPKCQIVQKSHQAIYPIVIIPAIEADKKKHNYSLVTAWALNIPAQENEDYDVEGVVLANPETQKLEIILYRMTKDESSLDNFELTEDMIRQLEVFKCLHPPLLQ